MHLGSVRCFDRVTDFRRLHTDAFRLYLEWARVTGKLAFIRLWCSIEQKLRLGLAFLTAHDPSKADYTA